MEPLAVERVMARERRYGLIDYLRRYLGDPRGELMRVLDWFGLPASEAAIERACRRIKPALVHHRVNRAALVAPGLRKK
jgi:hypothetical protein